jgi:predicted nucleic acid-binding protein
LKRFVLDASVALAWFVDHPLPPQATKAREFLLRGGTALVPALWHLEMANGFAMAERRRILSAPALDECLIKLNQLLAHRIETSSTLISLREALTTARSFHLSAYDAVYLATARNQALPLATLDRELRAAASKAGVEVIG